MIFNQFERLLARRYLRAKRKEGFISVITGFAFTGHPAGGVCPFAVNPGVEIYLDRSLQKYDCVFPACGSADSAIGLSIAELERYSGGVWVDVCKNGES